MYFFSKNQNKTTSQILFLLTYTWLAENYQNFSRPEKKKSPSILAFSAESEP
jgi:hypothetical protein